MDITPEIIKLTPSDTNELEKLAEVFYEVFEMEGQNPPGQAYLKALLENKSLIAFAIRYHDEIVGGLTSYELPMIHAEFSELYLYDLAIKPAFQRKGLGKLLLLELESYCRENNIKTFFVEAQEVDIHAIDFYHSTGGQSEKVFHFNYEIKQ